MMNKRVLSSGIIYFLCAAFVLLSFGGCQLMTKEKSNASLKNALREAQIVLDAPDIAGLPANFRIATAAFIKKDRQKPGRAVNLRGLSELDISGSAQFSQKELAAIKKAIGKPHIVIVDLRQESHGFVNGNAISLMGRDDKINKGQSDAESEQSQNVFLNALKSGSKLVISGEKNPITVDSVVTEKQIVEKDGMSYLRLPVTDREKPSDDSVNKFLSAFKSLPKDSWLHFHCKAGQGRTTTFMCMTDMIRNAKYTPFDDIIYRQYLIGGLDLTDKSTGEDVAGRLAFLKSFYNYCRENTDGFKTPYISWAYAQALSGAPKSNWIRLNKSVSYFNLDKPNRCWQGVVSDGNFYYVTTDRDEKFKFDDIIEIYSKNGVLLKTVKNAYIKKDPTNHFMSFGSPAIIGGKLFVPSYNINGGDRKYLSRAEIYNLSSLKLENDVNLGSNIAEDIVFNKGFYWVCYYDKMVLKKYSPAFKLLKVYTLPRKMNIYGGYQGIVWDGSNIYLNWHGPNKRTQKYGGGLDEYYFNGTKFIYKADFKTPTFGCGQSVSRLPDGRWLWADRVMNRVVVSAAALTAAGR